MATVSQLRTAAANAGFSGTALTIAVAIALAESGGNENASHKNSNGTTDMGAWQINSVHTDLLTGKNPYNLQDNADMAFALYRASNFAPWVTFKNGAYQQYLTAAQGGDSGAGQGAKHQSKVFGSTAAGNVASVAIGLNPISDINGLISAITQGAFWKRVGIGFLALILVFVGLVLMIESSKTVRGATVKAGEAAVLA